MGSGMQTSRLGSFRLDRRHGGGAPWHLIRVEGPESLLETLGNTSSPAAGPSGLSGINQYGVASAGCLRKSRSSVATVGLGPGTAALLVVVCSPQGWPAPVGCLVRLMAHSSVCSCVMLRVDCRPELLPCGASKRWAVSDRAAHNSVSRRWVPSVCGQGG